jgi:HK97 family phage portal protein
MNEIVRRRGRIQSIWPLHPAKTTPKYTEVPAGSNERPILYYELDNKRKLAQENCLHFAGMGFNGVVGYSPIIVNRQSVGVSIAQEQYQASFYGNGAKTSGWIKMLKKLSQPAQENWRKTFNQIHQGSQSAHQIGFLEEGMDWVQNNFSPQEAELILGRGFQVLEVARMYRIPPHKIGDYSESHISSTEEANLDYISMTLYGWVCMAEAQMNLKLLTREQRRLYTIGIDMSALLRGNVEARMKRIETMHATGAWCADDILRSEGLNPIGPKKGGDKHLVQMQYVPLEDAGKQPAMPPIPGKPEKKSEFPALEERLSGHLNGSAA